MRLSSLGLALLCPCLTACAEGGAGDEREPAPDGEEVRPMGARVRVLAGDAADGSVDGPALLARFRGVTALCSDPARDGVVYLSDTFNGTVRRVDLDAGQVTTVAGAAGRIGLSDGLGGQARLSSPRGLACLGSGLLVADSGALRWIDGQGRVKTVAGFLGAQGDADGDAATARMGYLIHAMIESPGGGVVFSDRSNDSVRSVDLETFEVRTVARGLSGPGGLAFDADPSRVWVADTFADRLVAVDLASGEVSPLAVGGVTLRSPQGLVIRDGEAWVSGFGSELWVVDLATGEGRVAFGGFRGAFASPALVTEGGKSTLLYPALGSYGLRALDLETFADRLLAGAEGAAEPTDGTEVTARFGFIVGMAKYADSLFLADDSRGLRRVDLVGPNAFGGGVEVHSLSPRVGGAQLTEPYGVAVHGASNRLAVSEPRGGRVWIMALDEASGGGSPAATLLEGFVEPAGLAFDDDGVLYIADAGGHRILAWAGQAVASIVGDGSAGGRDGTGEEARLDGPSTLSWDAGRARLWVGEAGSSDLRRLDPRTGALDTVLLGATDDHPSTDGPMARARIGAPWATLALPGPGEEPGVLLIADGRTHTIRRLVFAGAQPSRLETVVGVAGRLGGLPPGPEFAIEDATFSYPSGLAVAEGRLIITSDTAIYEVSAGQGLSW